MRNPRFWRNLSLAAFLSGFPAVAAAFLMPPEWAGDLARGVTFCYGVMALLFGGMNAWICQRDLRSKEALARGEDVLARWRVEPEMWRAFSELHERLQQSYGHISNEVVVSDDYLHAGAEVIIGQSAMQVGEHVFTLPRRSTPEVTQAAVLRWTSGPAYVEFHLKYPGGAGPSGVPRPPLHTILRFPVPEEALPQARQAAQVFEQGRPGKADFFHGRGDGTDPEDLSECVLCGYKTYKFASQCPRCGGGLLSKRWSRRFGCILLICGLFLTGLMGTVAFYTVPMMLRPGEQIGGTRFSGTPLQALFVLGIYTLVGTFGLTCILYGLWQMWTGRRNLKVMLGMVWLFGILLAVGLFIAWFG